MALSTDEAIRLLETADEIASCSFCKHEYCNSRKIEHVAADTDLHVAVLMCLGCGDFSVLRWNALEGLWIMDRPSRIGLARLMRAPIGRVIERRQQEIVLGIPANLLNPKART